MTINLLDVKKYYKEEPHQLEAVDFLGGLLLKTPAAEKLGLLVSTDFLELEDEELEWLQKQISKATLDKFATIWRKEFDFITPTYFSQRDNSIKPYVTCNSSSHAMLVDYYLRANGKPGLNSDEKYLQRVFSGRYGRYGSNPSVSWDIQVNVCRSFGVLVKYSWDSKMDELIKELEKGVACVNIWHKGTNRSTRGGGHVILAVDYDPEKGVLVFDPFGTKCGNYAIKGTGKYWISPEEWAWRWQGNRTIFLGLK